MSKGMPDFADRLNALFERVPDPATNKPYTNAAVALELSEAGTPVTAAYLGLLRAAKKQDPSARLVGALASFFGVPVDYFFDSGKAASIDRVNDTPSRAGSASCARMSARHIEDNAGGNSSGKFFEGNAAEMHEALNKRLGALPDDTVVYVSLATFA